MQEPIVPSSPMAPRCPRCGDTVQALDLQRIRRLWIDRVISLFQLRHRFRCRLSGCRWEGTLPVR